MKNIIKEKSAPRGGTPSVALMHDHKLNFGRAGVFEPEFLGSRLGKVEASGSVEWSTVLNGHLVRSAVPFIDDLQYGPERERSVSDHRRVMLVEPFSVGHCVAMESRSIPACFACRCFGVRKTRCTNRNHDAKQDGRKNTLYFQEVVPSTNDTRVLPPPRQY